MTDTHYRVIEEFIEASRKKMATQGDGFHLVPETTLDFVELVTVRVGTVVTVGQVCEELDGLAAACGHMKDQLRARVEEVAK